jgi:hypothetical protein
MILVVTAATTACGGGSSVAPAGADALATIDGAGVDGAGSTDASLGGSRDWIRHPAVYAATGVTTLWALSDVHGDRDRLVALLAGAGLVGGSASAPTWRAGTDTLVVSGDNIDKGPQSVEVLDYWIALIPAAAAAGGHVVVLLGNHEVEFLVDPNNSKAAALDAELTSETPQMFADPSDPRGRFLRECPIAALIDGWFFSHAGNSQGMSATQIATSFRALVDAGSFGDSFLIGPDSILEARTWWPSSGTAAFLDGYLAALPARHIVFGHSPSTFASSPSGKIEMHFAGRLTLIDVGMSSAVNDSTGKLLRVTRPGTASEAASMVSPSGQVTALGLTAP